MTFNHCITNSFTKVSKTEYSQYDYKTTVVKDLFENNSYWPTLILNFTWHR